MAKTNTTTNTTTASNWNSFSTASTITGYTTGTFKVSPTYKPLPFSIMFSYESKEVSVSLKNGEDIFRLAKVFMKILEDNNIEYNIKTKGKKSKK
jgi:hypothetical protein